MASSGRKTKGEKDGGDRPSMWISGWFVPRTALVAHPEHLGDDLARLVYAPPDVLVFRDHHLGGRLLDWLWRLSRHHQLSAASRRRHRRHPLRPVVSVAHHAAHDFQRDHPIRELVLFPRS